MTLQEMCLLLGKSESTMKQKFKRTQENLAKKGFTLIKIGQGESADYQVILPDGTKKE